MTKLTILTLCCLVAGVGACSNESAPTTSTQSSTPAQPQWLLAAMPSNAAGVASLKETVKQGDTIAIRGRIGGSVEPFTPGSAAFVIVDEAIPDCDRIEKDHCVTPWDYCCEPRDSLTANSATVMLVDEHGNPLSIDLQESGLKPLDDVVAVGVVGPRPTPQVLVVRATKLHRVGG